MPAGASDGGRAIADHLLDINTGPHQELAAHLLRNEPSRLTSLLMDRRLDERDRFELALTAMETRQPTDEEWAAMLEPLLMSPLNDGHWVFAAELWLRLPAPLRARAAAHPELAPLKTRTDGSLRPMLALGLIAIDEKEEAKKIVLTTPSDDLHHLGRELARRELPGGSRRVRGARRAELRSLDHLSERFAYSPSLSIITSL